VPFLRLSSVAKAEAVRCAGALVSSAAAEDQGISKCEPPRAAPLQGRASAQPQQLFVIVEPEEQRRLRARLRARHQLRRLLVVQRRKLPRQLHILFKLRNRVAPMITVLTGRAACSTSLPHAQRPRRSGLDRHALHDVSAYQPAAASTGSMRPRLNFIPIMPICRSTAAAAAPH